MLTLGHEVPAVVIGLGAGVVVHEDLVQGLQGQVAGVFFGGGAVGFGPVLGDESVQNTGLDHLGLDLVAVLNQGHGEGAGVLQGVGGELIEDLVVLGLLPLKLQGVAGIDGLQILDEQRQGALATAGVAHAVEHLAVGLFNGLLGQFLQGHALGFLNDFLGFRQIFRFRRSRCGCLGFAGAIVGSGRGLGAAAGSQSKHQRGDQEQRDDSFHVFISSFVNLTKIRCGNPPPIGYFYCKAKDLG
ncbi:MAG TPA: hypothetical protein IAC30_00800 [Candidatus Faecousia intestinavium]|nr:hypothetical protein [Candidatus Faecousia intestinavium]